MDLRSAGPPLARVAADSGVAVLGALALSLGALALGLALWPIDHDDSVAALLFLLAVGLTGWFGGLGPALVPTLIGGLAIDYFFETPRFDLTISNDRTFLDVASFVLIAVLVGLLNHRLREANLQLHAERDQAELQRDRAESAVRARDELLATVSHALRTPLTTIQTAVFCLRDGTVAVPLGERDELLAKVGYEVDRLVHFVTDALALSRLENAPPIRLESNDVGDLVWSALARCRPLLGDRPATFALSDDLPDAYFDEGLLDQAVVAVLENVAAHTPPGSPVWIHVEAREQDVRIDICDAGPGIPTGDRERIFRKYERLSHDGPGTGLGLAIARAAVQAQGGQLWAEASPHGGAAFVFSIPRATERRVPAAA